MLICNNCSTVNEEHTIRCIHCNMQGNFREQIGESRSDESLSTPKSKPCQNCGNHSPGEGSKCVHCHFPIQGKKAKINAELNDTLPTFQNTSQKLK